MCSHLCYYLRYNAIPEWWKSWCWKLLWDPSDTVTHVHANMQAHIYSQRCRKTKMKDVIRSWFFGFCVSTKRFLLQHCALCTANRGSEKWIQTVGNSQMRDSWGVKSICLKALHDENLRMDMGINITSKHMDRVPLWGLALRWANLGWRKR